MRSFYKRGIVFTLSMMLAATSVSAQTESEDTPSLLPFPDSESLPAYPNTTSRRSSNLVSTQATQAQPTLAPLPPDMPPAPVMPATPQLRSKVTAYAPAQAPAPGNAPAPPAPAPSPSDSATQPYSTSVFEGLGSDCWSSDYAPTRGGDQGLGCGTPTCCSPWFAGFTGLAMSRNKANEFWTSYETNNNANQVMNTNDAKADWNGGGEIRLGRWFSGAGFGGGVGCGNGCGCNGCGGCGNCSRSGLEVVYWALAPLNGYSSVRGDDFAGGSVSTPINLEDQLGPVLIGATPAEDFFDGATEHRIWRNDNIQSLELNLITQQLYNTGHAQLTWLAGVRWFRFDDSLIFGSVAGGSEFGDNVGPNVNGAAEAYLSSSAINNLVGFQVGARGDYYFTPAWYVFGAPKIGIYSNSQEVRNRLYTGDGIEGFDINGDTVEFSMLAQIDLGTGWQFSENWRAFIGYRGIAVTQVALADHQFLPYLADTQGFGEVKSNGSLIVHGGFAGIECRF